MTETTVSRWLGLLAAVMVMLSVLVACARGVGDAARESTGNGTEGETEEPVSAEVILPPDTLLFESLGGGYCAVTGLGSWQDPVLKIPEQSPAGDLVIRIASRAFFGCPFLKEVWIPATVREIGALAFGGCGALRAIGVSEDNPCFASPGGVLYTKDYRVLMHYPAMREGEKVLIPATVAVISEMAFYGCVYLSTVEYASSAADWERIAIAPRNYSLTAASVNYT